MRLVFLTFRIRFVYFFALIVSFFWPVGADAQLAKVACGPSVAKITFSDGAERCVTDFSFLTRTNFFRDDPNGSFAARLSSSPTHALATTSDPESCKLHFGWFDKGGFLNARLAEKNCQEYMKEGGSPPECSCKLLIDSGRSPLSIDDFRNLILKLDLQASLGREPLASFGTKKLRASSPRHVRIPVSDGFLSRAELLSIATIFALPKAIGEAVNITKNTSDVVTASVSATRERRVALVMGNSNYKVRGWSLENPANDALDIASALREVGFRVSLLLDATLAQMRTAARTFESASKEADVALIYYVGHGIEDNGKNYMVPVDAEILRDTGIADRAYDASQWMAMFEASKKNNPERVDIVILDACRDNPFSVYGERTPGLALMDAPPGTLLVYSTAPGKKAADGVGTRNSPFTRNFLKALREPSLPIEQMLNIVRSRVNEETSGQQIPWESSSLVGDFRFRR
jgi:hypothetical protein